MTGHEFGEVDIDLLADYVGGALAGTPGEAAVAARIADDPQWRAAYDSLDAGMAFVAAELGRFDPEPMPADVAERLEAVLASPLAGATHASHLAPVHNDRLVGSRENPVRRKAQPNAHRMRRWVTPVAVAAGLIAFVGFGLDYLSGRSSHESSDTSSAGSAMSRAPSSEHVTASGIDYTLQTLATGPVQPLTTAASGSATPHKASPGMAAEGAAALNRLLPAEALAACLEAIQLANAGGEISVESVDYARFRGAPALVVRFSADNGRWAWASGPACGTEAGGAAKLAAVPVG